MSNKLSKYILVLCLGMILLVLPLFSAVSAATITPAITQKPKATTSPATQQQRIDNLKTRSVSEIQRRIDSLNALITKVQAMKKLTNADKTMLISGIQATVNDLKELLQQIQTETNLDNLKTEVKSIVDSYRIYVFYIPKVKIMSTTESQLESIDTLTGLVTKLQGIISNAASKGKDVKAVNLLLQDMQTQIITAKTNANGAYNSVVGLEPGGYPANAPTLKNAAQQVKTAHQAISSATQDAHKIRDALTVMPTK